MPLPIRAAVLRDRNAPFVLEDLDLADPRHGQVLVRIVGVGFCHTDILPRDPGYFAAPPIIVGHEGSGIVEAIADGVSGVAVDDHVVLSFDSCHDCDNCRTGRPAYCFGFFSRNLSGCAPDGPGPVTDRTGTPISSRWFGQSSMATYTVVDARNLTVVDRSLPIELLGPLGCGVQTGAGSVLNTLDTAAGSAFAVFGAGAVGLSAVMAAKVAGAARIIAIDLNSERLDLAHSLGATDVLLATEDQIAKRIRKMTGGGVHTALDTTGVSAVIATALDSLRPAGRLGTVGTATGDLVLPGSALAKGKHIMGILEGDAVPQVFLPRLIALWRQGVFPFDRLIRTYPLTEINAAEADAADGSVIKPVLLSDV
jgi:aryl-alcohol dehydrogenase